MALDVEKFIAWQRRHHRIPPDAKVIGFRQNARSWYGTYELEGAVMTLKGKLAKALEVVNESTEVPQGAEGETGNQATSQSQDSLPAANGQRNIG